MKIDSVVVGMDFSDVAIETAKWVASVFAPAAELILAHALELDRDRFLPEATYPTSPDAALHEAAAERTRDIARLVTTRRARVDVRSGRAHEVLRDIVLETGADLIAVGPHGYDAPESRLLGTTTDRLIRTTRVPVLVGGHKPIPSARSIVVGVDASSLMPSVLAWAGHAGDVFDAKVTVIHASPTTDDAFETQRATAWLGREAAFAGIESTRLISKIAHGDAAECILDAATRQAAALIVVGRRDPIGGLPALLGRTLRHILHEADCAVLVVTPTEDEIVDEPE